MLEILRQAISVENEIKLTFPIHDLIRIKKSEKSNVF